MIIGRFFVFRNSFIKTKYCLCFLEMLHVLLESIRIMLSVSVGVYRQGLVVHVEINNGVIIDRDCHLHRTKIIK